MNTNNLTIHPIPVLKDNYIWAIIDPKQQTVLIVDPGEAQPVVDYLTKNNIKLMGILISHHHWDHTNGIAELKNTYSVPVAGPANENIVGVTLPMYENDELHIQHFPLTFQILSIPGHTLGHIAYYAPGILFCGDTLFAAGCGRIFEGTPEQMFASLQKIAELPDTTKIYCAHEYTLSNLRFAEVVEPGNKLIADRIKTVSELRQKNLPSLPSTLHDEKATNPFLRCDSPEIIRSVEKYAGKSLANPLEIFATLREWKNKF